MPSPQEAAVTVRVDPEPLTEKTQPGAVPVFWNSAAAVAFVVPLNVRV